MADIISLNKKLRHTEEKKAAIIRRRKIQAVQKIFQCTQCAFKCEKCGMQIDPPEKKTESKPQGIRIPYRFCESCSEEYRDYIERLKGKTNPDCYWHNDDWLEIWRRWIDYQGAIDRYLKSKEIVQLLRELKDTTPDE